jgi:hypothetical protein
MTSICAQFSANAQQGLHRLEMNWIFCPADLKSVWHGYGEKGTQLRSSFPRRIALRTSFFVPLSLGHFSLHPSIVTASRGYSIIFTHPTCVMR